VITNERLISRAAIFNKVFVMFSALRIPLRIKISYKRPQEANLTDEEIKTRIYSKIEETLKHLEDFIVTRHKHSCVNLHHNLENRCLVFNVKSSAELENLGILLEPSGKHLNEFSLLATNYYEEMDLSALCKLSNTRISLRAEMSDEVYTQTKHRLEKVEDNESQPQ